VPRAWPHIRAVLIVVHLFAITVLAMPAPGSGLQRSAWDDPTVKEEFSAWRARLDGWGLHYEEDEFEEMLWTVASGYQKSVRKVTDPFKPYYRYAGTHQSWRMFVAPHMNPSILHIDVRVNNEWQTVYVENSDAFTWNRELFDHDRMRSAMFRYAWPGWRTNWERLGDWLAVRLADDYPEATLARFRYWKYRSLSPEQVAAGDERDGRFYRRYEVDLTELRE